MSLNHITLTVAIFLPVLLDAHFTTYWNIFSWHCKKELEPIVDNFHIIHNTGMNYSGDKVALFYEFTFGRYPYFRDYLITEPINYGTPQNVTSDPDRMQEHLTIAEYNITTTIRGQNYTTLAVVDFEEWRPLFRQNGGRKKVYQDAAKMLVEQAHPSYTPQEVLKAATEEYEESAKEFILETLKKARDLRPYALWGMYGFPYCNYDAGEKDDDYECSKTYQQWNDDMMYIFNESTALFPSIYLGFPATSQQRFRYVQAILREANRIAQKYQPPLPIYPYTKFEYDPLEENCSFYDDYDLCSTLKQPAMMGVDGLIFWSSSRNMKYRCPAIMDFVENKLGPIVQNVTAQYYVPGPFNITEILNFNDTCSTFNVPVTNIQQYGNLCNVSPSNPSNTNP
uniref:Hyaluronidase n=1 Tax=Haemonchus contortus TaxID=6289 RepID=A0A7I4Y8G3_HAECO